MDEKFGRVVLDIVKNDVFPLLIVCIQCIICETKVHCWASHNESLQYYRWCTYLAFKLYFSDWWISIGSTIPVHIWIMLIPRGLSSFQKNSFAATINEKSPFLCNKFDLSLSLAWEGDSNCVRNMPYGPISYVYVSYSIIGRAPLLDWPYPNMRLLNQDQQLELSSVSMSQEGHYSCKVTNPAGRDRQQFHLTVLRE